MNTNQTPVAEITLLIHALESVYVADMETTRQKLLTQLRGEMVKRGIKSFNSAEQK
jgi:hypothetical protein